MSCFLLSLCCLLSNVLLEAGGTAVSLTGAARFSLSEVESSDPDGKTFMKFDDLHIVRPQK